MRKFAFFITLAIFCASTMKGQNSADIQTKDAIILELQNNIAKLEKEIEYYKTTLDLLNSKIIAEDQNVEFKINLVTGDSNTGKIVIEGIFINNGVLRSIQGWQANAFDLQGNEMRTFAVAVGSGGKIPELHRDIPTKFRIEFTNSIPDTPMLTALTIKFYSSVGIRSNDISIMFRNIPVEWR
jgi:hypothetical protein